MQFCYEYSDPDTPQVRPTLSEKPLEGLDTINKWLYRYNYRVRVHGFSLRSHEQSLAANANHVTKTAGAAPKSVLR